MANNSFDFNIEPYYDDFNEPSGPRENNYMRILFRPGYAVQARELTQIQSILQNQIKAFGDHIFKDGSPVEGGHITLDTNVVSIKLNKQQNGIDVDLNNLDGQMVTDDTAGNVSAKVIAVDSTQTYPTVMVKYLTGDEFAATHVMNAASTLTTATVISGGSAIDTGSIASINEGIFYVEGYFVYVPPQTIILDPYETNPSYKIGLQIVDQIIDESTDTSLLDPAQQSFNYQAPGATRYQYNLELSKRALNSIDDTRFFELMRVQNGIVTKVVEYPIYSELEKTLARRTYDESGDYTVKPFRLTVSENPANTDLFRVNIEPGKAYVKGYEFETVGTVSFTNEKALTKNTSTEYNFSLDYGNYIIVNNVYGSNTGFANISSYPEFDLHVVPTANINTTSETIYSNTKIGTARIRNMDYAGGNDYYAYLLDVNTAPITFNAWSTADNTSAINFGDYMSAYDTAYVGVKLKVTGTGEDSYIRTVTHYDGDSKVAIVDIPFTTPTTTSSRVSLLMSIGDSDSVVKRPALFTESPYVPQVGGLGSLPSMDVAPNGKAVDGRTILTDSAKSRVVYPLPESYVSGDDAFLNVEYYKKKFYAGVTSSGGTSGVTSTRTISLDSGADNWFFGNGALSTLTAKTNFIVTVRDNGGSSQFSNGQLIVFDGSNTATQVSTSEIQIGIPSDESFTVDVIATVKFDNDGGEGTKTLKGNISAVMTGADNSTGSLAVKFQNGSDVGKVNVKFSGTDTAQVWFRSATLTSGQRLIANTPGVPQSLYVTDVVRLVKAYDSGDLAYEPNVSNAIDITERYLLDGGQRDNYYDFASVILRDGFLPPKGQTVFFIQSYESTGGYYNARSYSDYEQIPNYISSTGSISLRDAVDFRPVRANSNTTSPELFTLQNAIIPSPEFSFEATYDYYVPRVDRLVLTRDKEFKIVQGTPSIRPVAPKVPDDSMLLYTLNIPAYTANVADIGLLYKENKRYTMRDIGSLEKRIENLEYYTSLNVLEQQAKNQNILYEDNFTEKEKYGIIADDFSDFSVADKYNTDLVCNISKARLGPYRINSPLKMEYLGEETAGRISLNERTVSLAFTEEPCVVQNTATKTISVQPFQFGQFHGSASLFPESDYWYSQTLMPEVISPGTDFVKVEMPPAAPEGNSNPNLAPNAVVPTPPPVVGTTTTNTVRNVFVSQDGSETTINLNPDGFGGVDFTTNWFPTQEAQRSAFTTGMGGPFTPTGGSNIDVGQRSIFTASRV